MKLQGLAGLPNASVRRLQKALNRQARLKRLQEALEAKETSDA